MDDSLAKKVANTPLTFKKAEIYYQAGDDIAIQDTLKAIRYIRKGLQYAKGNPYYELLPGTCVYGFFPSKGRKVIRYCFAIF